jgi:hypothetical protein
VPQGSSLGPLLFIVGSSLKECKELEDDYAVFADDVNVFASAPSAEEAIEKLKIKFDVIKRRFLRSGLRFSPSIFQLMFVGPSSRLRFVLTNTTILIDGIAIRRAKSITWLGIIIDEMLTYREHCKSLLKDTNSKMLYLVRSCSNLSKDCREKLADVLVYSRWAYSDYVWCDAGKQLHSRFQAQQRFLARWVIWGRNGIKPDENFKSTNTTLMVGSYKVSNLPSFRKF